MCVSECFRAGAGSFVVGDPRLVPEVGKAFVRVDCSLVPVLGSQVRDFYSVRSEYWAATIDCYLPCYPLAGPWFCVEAPGSCCH